MQVRILLGAPIFSAGRSGAHARPAALAHGTNAGDSVSSQQHKSGREEILPVMSGKRAFLDLLKQEGVEVLFGNPGTTELPLMDALRHRERAALPARPAGGRRDGDGGRLRAGLGQAHGRQPARGAGSRQRHGHAVRRAEGWLSDSRHRRAARAELHRDRAHPVGRPADHRAADGEMVVGGAPAGRPAADGASRRQDRARAADRAGVPLAAGRHPARRRRHRPDASYARGAAHAWRQGGGRGGGGHTGASPAPA